MGNRSGRQTSTHDVHFFWTHHFSCDCTWNTKVQYMLYKHVPCSSNRTPTTRHIKFCTKIVSRYFAVAEKYLKTLMMYESGTVLYFASGRNRILKWHVLCALEPNCMAPIGANLFCNFKVNFPCNYQVFSTIDQSEPEAHMMNLFRVFSVFYSALQPICTILCHLDISTFRAKQSWSNGVTMQTVTDLISRFWI